MLFINALKLYVPRSLGLEYYVHVWKGVDIHACVHCTVTYICTYFHMYKHTYIHTYMNTYICTCTQIYSNKQTYLQTYIHAYIHTHSHPYVNTQIHTVRTVLTCRDTTMSKNVSHTHTNTKCTGPSWGPSWDAWLMFRFIRRQAGALHLCTINGSPRPCRHTAFQQAASGDIKVTGDKMPTQ